MSKVTTGDVRDILASSLKKAAKSKLSAADGKNLIGLSNQISKSMAVEIKHTTMQKSLGNVTDTFGTVIVGNNKP